MAKSPWVYIVIVNYLQWEDTISCLESVLDSDYSNFTIIIIDNKSPNDSSKKLISEMAKFASAAKKSFRVLDKNNLDVINSPELRPEVIFIQNDRNAGFAAANNIILKTLCDEDAYVWLLNPDMVVKKNTLSELLQEAVRCPETTVIGTLTKSFSDGNRILFYGGGKINFLTASVQMIKDTRDIEQLEYVSGSSLFTHAHNFSVVGLLPEKYFLYWEETDWCFQATARGIKLHVCPSAICYDKISTTIGKKFLADYYYARNGLEFISRYRKKNIPVVLFFMGFRFLKRIIRGRWQSARGVFKGVLDFLKSTTYEIQ